VSEETKFCLYCLLPHNRKARACSPWCEKRIRGKAAYVTRSRNEIVRRHMAELQRIHRHDATVREAALGQISIEETALRMFGTLPAAEISDPGEGRP
jgi:hypothetical protein